MDPDAALAELRELSQLPVWNMSGDDMSYAHGRLCEVFTALDEWVTSGNFKPKDWQEDLTQ